MDSPVGDRSSGCYFSLRDHLVRLLHVALLPDHSPSSPIRSRPSQGARLGPSQHVLCFGNKPATYQPTLHALSVRLLSDGAAFRRASAQKIGGEQRSSITADAPT